MKAVLELATLLYLTTRLLAKPFRHVAQALLSLGPDMKGIEVDYLEGNPEFGCLTYDSSTQDPYHQGKSRRAPCPTGNITLEDWKKFAWARFPESEGLAPASELLKKNDMVLTARRQEQTFNASKSFDVEPFGGVRRVNGKLTMINPNQTFSFDRDGEGKFFIKTASGWCLHGLRMPEVRCPGICIHHQTPHGSKVINIDLRSCGLEGHSNQNLRWRWITAPEYISLWY
jgi:hypothetical protein